MCPESGCTATRGAPHFPAPVRAFPTITSWGVSTDRVGRNVLHQHLGHTPARPSPDDVPRLRRQPRAGRGVDRVSAAARGPVAVSRLRDPVATGRDRDARGGLKVGEFYRSSTENPPTASSRRVSPLGFIPSDLRFRNASAQSRTADYPRKKFEGLVP